MVKEIPLINSELVVVVDDCDFELVSRFIWRPKPDKYTCYAIRTAVVEGKKTTIRLHREILNPPVEMAS